MSGPLDDALNRHDRQRDQLEQRLRDGNVKMQALVADFLRRMNAAGDPGARNLGKTFSDTWPVIPRFGWDFKVHSERLRIFKNGNVLYLDHTGRFSYLYFGPLRKANLGHVGLYADEFTTEMARVLRENGVRLCPGKPLVSLL